ncbi:MAG: spermidine/putrescine ABC transporter substrate-binding protein [Planctomycetota bacterium]|nr:spermidine/putrescine ABC transporter substrate-binding protein [Planctomycetota bacterium]
MKRPLARLFTLASLCFAAMLLAGCDNSTSPTARPGAGSSATPSATQPSADQPITAGQPGSTQPASGANGSAKKLSGVLNLYIWSEYIPPAVLEEFTKRTGVKVNVDNYDSNETLLQKLQSGVVDYDLCVPTDYMIKILIEQKLLRPLDAARLPNLKNVDPRFLKRGFDPEQRFCVPYLWGTTGVGYNKQSLPGGVEGWGAMFDPANKGKILMLDDMRECFAAALKSMGKSLNSTNADDIKAAAELLKKQKALVKTYNSSDYDNILASGDVSLAQGYNGQIAKLAAKEPAKFAYVIPKEGTTWSMDAMCIPVKAQNPDAAVAFLNFILEPEIAAQIVNGVNYASTNAAAKAFIKKEILENPAIYPPADLLKKCEAMEDLGEATSLMDRYWTEIKAE